MEGILVGVDESAYSQAALRWAVAYAAECGLPVTALLAWDYIGQHHADPNEEFDPHYGSEKADNVLEALVCGAVGSRSDIARIVVCNHAGPALIEAAGEGASMIVVGARGMNGFKGLLLGSVSRHVLHAAKCPVAVIRDDAVRVDEPVVVGVDGSESSRRALEWAVGYATSRRAKLAALHAWTVPYSPYGLYAAPDLSKMERAAKQILIHEVATVDQAGLIEPIELRNVEGSPSAVLREASALSSLIVVGSRGRGPFTNWVLGSVSDQLTHYANCPVVVVP